VSCIFAGVIACVIACITASAFAATLPPVQRSQYQLANSFLPENIHRLAFRLSIEPHWIGEGKSKFWYFRQDALAPAYILVDPATKTKSPLFDHGKLAQALGKALSQELTPEQLDLQGLNVDADLAVMRFSYGSKHWVWQISEGLLDIGQSAAKSNAAISPDGKWQAITSNGNLFLRELSSGKQHALSSDGSPEFAYAMPLVNPRLLISGVHATASEAVDVSWSPDSSKIASFKMNLKHAASLTLVQSSPPGGGTRPKTFNYPYALSGDQETALASMVIFDVASGRRSEVQLPPQPVLYYGSPDLKWSRDSRSLYTLVPERGYASLNLYKIDAVSGNAQLLIKEDPKPFADYYGHRYQVLDEQNEIYWTSDRSGWKHYARYDANTGALLNSLSGGAWRALEILQADHQRGLLFMTGAGREAGRDPYFRHLYRVQKNGEKLSLLTPEALDHEVSLSPDHQYFVDNMSAANVATRSVLRDTATGAIVMELEKADISALLATGFRLPEPFQTKAADGKTAVYGLLYRPVKFRAGQRYPVIDNIYSGPHTSYTPKSLARTLKNSALPLTALDFAVVYVDGRGTNRRSREFLNHSYKNLGNNGYDDHEVAIRDIGSRDPVLDLENVGIFGFSAGGYDTVRAMLTRPDFFKAGWAASGNHDHRSDKAVWNEQWMGGLPLGPEYDRDSNLTLAKNLQGKLMIAHGELDTNVNPMASMQLVNALIQANKDFEMLWMPNADHFLDDSAYYNRRRWDFFIRHLQHRAPLDGFEAGKK
jgi:dipeptidyl aminopeptidase/acylaminoacyl peptidase